MSVSGSGFADGIEFEETFPEVLPLPVSAPTHATRPADAILQESLDRRLREAEVMIRETIERMRLDEEQRLTQWTADRRAEEERRLESWLHERRLEAERSETQRPPDADGVAERVQRMLFEWQGRFENSWRSELEQALAERLAQPVVAPIAQHAASTEVSTDPLTSLETATSARDVGRILRGLLADLTHTSSFAIALHDAGAHEVAYRYRVASEDDLGALLRRDALDDGPQGAAANSDEWTRAQRTVRVGSRNVVVHSAQLPIRTNEATLGVLTLQSDGAAIPDGILAKAADLTALAAPRLAVLRDSASFKGV